MKTTPPKWKIIVLETHGSAYYEGYGETYNDVYFQIGDISGFSIDLTEATIYEWNEKLSRYEECEVFSGDDEDTEWHLRSQMFDE